MSDRKITISNGKIVVPDFPIIPFIEGDGTGPDIWAASEEFLMQQLIRHIKASARLNGLKYLLVKNHLNKMANGYHRKPWILLTNILLQ